VTRALLVAGSTGECAVGKAELAYHSIQTYSWVIYYVIVSQNFHTDDFFCETRTRLPTLPVTCKLVGSSILIIMLKSRDLHSNTGEL